MASIKLPTRLNQFVQSRWIITNFCRAISVPDQCTQLNLFACCDESQSEAILAEQLAMQTELYSTLGFHFKVIEVPSEELDLFASHKYELAAWLPSVNDYCTVLCHI